MILKGNICRTNNCSHCCRGTEMPLTDEDIKRISGAGHYNFYDRDRSQLVNINGRCFFLTEEGNCTIYTIRPEGCRWYPLIMALPSRTPILDEECPKSREFNIDPEDLISLEELISTLEKEGTI
jgi:uncharacterized protein